MNGPPRHASGRVDSTPKRAKVCQQPRVTLIVGLAPSHYHLRYLGHNIRLSAPFLRGMIQDSNASCLDVALEAVLIFADTYNQASQHSSEVAPGIVAKGLSGRPGTATRAEEALLKFMEVSSHHV